MQFVPYLNFNGNCREAFAFYAGVFGVEVPGVMTYAEAPEEMRAQMPENTHGHIMHTQLEAGGGLLMGADGPPSEGKPSGLSTNIMVEDPAEAERIFAALTDGGRVDFPIRQTFWAARFGMGTDRYGMPWMVNCSTPA